MREYYRVVVRQGLFFILGFPRVTPPVQYGHPDREASSFIPGDLRARTCRLALCSLLRIGSEKVAFLRPSQPVRGAPSKRMIASFVGRENRNASDSIYLLREKHVERLSLVSALI